MVHLHAIKSGLRSGKFQETIAVAKPKTLPEFCEKAKGQIDIDKLRQARKSDKTYYRDDDKAQNSKKNFKLTPRFDSYTQFNTKQEDIIKEILNSKLIKPPRKAGTYQDTKNVDKSKYYAFHQKHDHTTDKCVVAKDLLERLAWQGHLDKYIGGHIQRRAPSSTGNTSSEQQNRGKEKASSSQYEQPRDKQIATIHRDHKEARQCYNISMRLPNRSKQAQVNNVHLSNNNSALADLDPRAEFLERPTPTGIAISTVELNAIQAFLQEQANLFAWRPSNMPSIDPQIITHRLAINPSVRPVQQKKRNLEDEKKKVSLEETQKLINADFIREIRFTTWLTNVVMVRKQNGKWRMCVDFTDLNKAYPKDSYPLPSIDSLVDNASGYATLNIMDAYSGATYQRLMDKVFANQISRNMEVYVNDMVAKTKSGNNHIDDLTEIFGQIRSYNMCLNPEKCAFAVQGGKFLGFLLTSRGIEANPDKCRVVLEMTSPKTIKEWNDDCEREFNTLKTTLLQPPILQKPLQEEELFLYLSITDWAISSTLVTERDKVQHPIYFVSKTLQHAEVNYPRIEKLALALLFSARKLRPYFQSHVIHVRTNHPLRQVLHKQKIADRLVKWSIELSEFDVTYQARGPIKSQFLADFIAELMIPTEDDHTVKWTLYVNGSSNTQGCGAGIWLEGDDGFILEHSLHLTFKANNNQSEYEVLVAGLRLCLDLHISAIKVYCDSLLVVQ
ncbi:uncharacterized protein LOC107485065 [Arachis duranensis]|uniref:Uncharacterized protein LOC107485065 n=1 Tax=Arachis duranensis TaxID=130453 RepID=A0A6P4D8N7_ARADU|nr:uncharacterized protein LOC107485065 [Arachis duranensis]